MTIYQLIENYKKAKARDNVARSNGRRGWNNHAVSASRLGQRIAQAARDDVAARQAVVDAELQEVYYYYTHDASIFRIGNSAA